MASDVDRIKNQLSIEEVVAPYVELKQAGKNLKGLSPFSEEKTPSFFVSPDRGLYHCFSTGQGGDMFTFIQEIEGVDFRGALEILAKQTGITLQGGTSNQDRKERDELFQIMEQATKLFQTGLKNHSPARDYLASRGVEEETIKEWQLGYAPDEWRRLYTYFTERGTSAGKLKQVGLAKESKGRSYDVFRGRLMFPIKDAAGRVVAFSGRLLEKNDKAPKYLNSPDTDLFQKSHVLYGYDQAKEHIRKSDKVVVVEGQFDLVLSHQAGQRNTVASSGSALSQRHVELMLRHTNHLTYVFDADDAGHRALLKASHLSLAQGAQVKVVLLPPDKDPADVIKEDPDRWEEIVQGARDLIPALLERISGGENVIGRVNQEIVPLIADMPNAIRRDKAIQEVARDLGISRESVREEVSKAQSQSRQSPRWDNDKRESSVSLKSSGDKLGKLIVRLRGLTEVVETDELRQQIADIHEMLTGDSEDRRGDKQAVFIVEAEADRFPTIDQYAKDILQETKREIIRRKLHSLQNQIKQAEQDDDQEALDNLLEKHRLLTQKMI